MRWLAAASISREKNGHEICPPLDAPCLSAFWTSSRRSLPLGAVKAPRFRFADEAVTRFVHKVWREHNEKDACRKASERVEITVFLYDELRCHHGQVVCCWYWQTSRLWYNFIACKNCGNHNWRRIFLPICQDISGLTQAAGSHVWNDHSCFLMYWWLVGGLHMPVGMKPNSCQKLSQSFHFRASMGPRRVSCLFFSSTIITRASSHSFCLINPGSWWNTSGYD